MNLFMTEYVSLPHNKKLNLLREHSMGCDWPDLDQEHWCLHCSQKFNGHSVRVWKDSEGKLWLAFRPIDGGIGRRVDDQIGAARRHDSLDRVGVRDIGLGTADGPHGPAGRERRFTKCRRDLAAMAEHQDQAAAG